jgi:hypothetical protein
MIAVPGTMAGRLAASWTDTARQIDEDAAVSRRAKSPWLDQVSLPIAAARLGVAIAPLDPRWNFPSWIWRIGDGGAPILFHYQKIARLRREAATRQAALAAATSLPGLQSVLPRSSSPLRDWLSKIMPGNKSTPSAA